MRVRDIMTTDVIKIPSSTTIAEADDILAAKKINRLPVKSVEVQRWNGLSLLHPS